MERTMAGWTRRATVLGAGAAAACSPGGKGGGAGGGKVVAFVPKFTSDPYFVSANQGAQEAGKALGLTVQYNGPVDANVAGQVDIVDRLVRAGVAAISICALDPSALAPSLERAQRRGIKVNTWDADVKPSARTVFLNQATYAAIGEAIAGVMERATGATGEFVMLTGSVTASNMVAWTQAIAAAVAKRPGMRITTTLLAAQDIEKGKNVILNHLRANPAVKGVFTNDGSATVSAAEAVKQLGLVGKVAIAGIGVPNAIRAYVKEGVVREAVLWNPVDIGYAALQITHAQLAGTLDPAKGALAAGRLGELKFTRPDELLLGPPLVFTRDNIDRYRF